VTGPSSEDLERILAESLRRRLPWRQRIVAWLKAHVAGVSGREGTAGGYWGGVTMWDRLKALAAQAASRATTFLRR